MELTDQQAIAIIKAEDHLWFEGINHHEDKDWVSTVKAAEEQTGQISEYHEDRIKRNSKNSKNSKNFP